MQVSALAIACLRRLAIEYLAERFIHLIREGALEGVFAFIGKIVSRVAVEQSVEARIFNLRLRSIPIWTMNSL